MDKLRREVETPAERARREHEAQRVRPEDLDAIFARMVIAVALGIALLPVGLAAAGVIEYLEQPR